MDFGNIVKRATRREILQATGALAGEWALSNIFPKTLAGMTPRFPQQGGAAAGDALAAARARFGKVFISSTKLSDNLTLLMGPGGNVVVLNGKDGKLLVDTFTQLAWDRFKKTLDEISSPVPLSGTEGMQNSFSGLVVLSMPVASTIGQDRHQITMHPL